MADLRTALEAAIFADPDALVNHMAYADYLVEQGDPRGEFIQVQLRLEDEGCQGEERKKLGLRERELLAYEPAWLGKLADHLIERDVEPYRQEQGTVNRWTWRRGWLDDVRFYHSDADSVRALVRSPAARLVRRLNLGEVGYTEDPVEPDDGADENPNYPCLYMLRQAAFLPHLRSLSLGEDYDLDNDYLNCRTGGEGLVELLSRTPRLEELLVYAAPVDYAGLFALTSLSRLESLHLFHMREEPPFAILAGNPAFGALRTLRVRPAHSWDEPGQLPLDCVLPLFRSPHPRSLEHLHLHASSMGDRGCEEILRSGVLRRLKTLDLTHGRVTDAGARILAASPFVRNLHTLSLENNQLTEAGVEVLEQLGLPNLIVGRQAEVGSTEYLMTGDME